VLAKSPEKFEGGTPSIADVLGLGRAVDYLSEIGMENIQEHENHLVKRMYDGLTRGRHDFLQYSRP
jgi:cysteine desulfurase/selenocysteine lyase